VHIAVLGEMAGVTGEGNAEQEVELEVLYDGIETERATVEEVVGAKIVDQGGEGGRQVGLVFKKVFGSEEISDSPFDGAIAVFVLHVDNAADGAAVEKYSQGTVGVGLGKPSSWGGDDIDEGWVADAYRVGADANDSPISLMEFEQSRHKGSEELDPRPP